METKFIEFKEKLNTPAEEAYNVLRSNILFNKGVKSLSIVSMVNGDGKTTTAINLAISTAKSGEKVLLVDADMRKSFIYKQLGTSDNYGLSSVLSNRVELEDAVNGSNIKNLYFLMSGQKPQNPSELLSSKSFVEFLNKAKSLYEMVIIDTPSLGSYIDGAIVASKTDGALAVLKAGVSNIRRSTLMKNQLEKANVKILGVILNNVKKKDFNDYYINDNR